VKVVTMGVNEAAGGRVVVTLRDVRKTYDVGGLVEALADVSFTLSEGTYTAVMGPSGSGKSTLLNLIGALDVPTTGQVSVDGQSIAALSADERAALRRRDIGFIFQTFNLLPRLDAVENVALPLVFDGVARRERVERASRLLEAVGLGDRLEHAPNELSGGQRQRVAIARALVTDPALLLADEPTGNVDSETGARVLDLFGDLHADGHTILLITHERAVAEHADRIIHLKDGRIHETETVDASTEEEA